MRNSHTHNKSYAHFITRCSILLKLHLIMLILAIYVHINLVFDMIAYAASLHQVH